MSARELYQRFQIRKDEKGLLLRAYHQHIHRVRRNDFMYAEEWDARENAPFSVELADALIANECADQAKELITREGLSKAYQRWSTTRAELDRLEPDWQRGISIQINYGLQGVDLIIRDAEDDPFTISIVQHDAAYGAKQGLYEICPFFEGKYLSDAEIGPDVIGFCTLERALRIAKATRTKKRENIERVLQEAA